MKIKLKPKQGLVNIYRFLVALTIVYILFSLILTFLMGGLEMTPSLKRKFFRAEETIPQKRIIGIIAPARYGELLQAKMVKQTIEKIGYEVYIFSMSDYVASCSILAKFVMEKFLLLLNRRLHPDLNLAISFHVNIEVPEPKIMYISVPPEFFIRRIETDYPSITAYNNFIDINQMNNAGDWLSKKLNRKIQIQQGIVGIPANEYKTSSRKKLLFYGSLWGRNSLSIQGAIADLAKQNYMYFVKSASLFPEFHDDYQYASQAINLEDLQARLNEYGIGLCIHSSFHNSVSIPSSRIFEIISSGAIAISDKNPFVMKYFGKNILYFDQNLSREEIFKQIESHVKWIQSHPVQSENMARNAHKILQKNFTTDKFVRSLLKNRI